MNLGYRLAYRAGFTPWEKAGRAIFAEQLNHLLDAVAVPGEAAARALDLGCGTGDHSIELAKRGWSVTAVDSVPLAIERARAKLPVAGADVRFVLGDVTHLPAYVDDHYTFALDVGCFHGLTDECRVAYGRGLTAVTAPGARLLMFAFSPGRRGPLPRGSSRRDVEQALAGWEVVGDDAMDTGSAPGLLARAEPRFYRLVRN
ncbi:methyltransferase domain-containing protein [Rhodococcus hoagii]|nr:class I SAM-dependent methyltransferase [Prescottella equi]GBF14269.1 magnesium-protoporphyrin O-methyltransferase [Rhodococcus sp. Br-6]AVP67546.1 class I SAM-dependent methyltransferase [Prescottella equi]MBM4734558.1 methyltransferase domain-containing protein [Prescottella equi]MDP8016771.1 class I SAM-dependent methyltransferase [Prescottella equi]NKR24547.1 methyltransferase domain-containing protein [Prescottella equi]